MNEGETKEPAFIAQHLQETMNPTEYDRLVSEGGTATNYVYALLGFSGFRPTLRSFLRFPAVSLLPDVELRGQSVWSPSLPVGMQPCMKEFFKFHVKKNLF
jgi:hypothetical protein